MNFNSEDEEESIKLMAKTLNMTVEDYKKMIKSSKEVIFTKRNQG